MQSLLAADNITYILLLILAVIPIIVCLRFNKKGFVDDCLSRDNMNVWKGAAAIIIVMHHLAQKIDTGGPLIIMKYVGFIMVAVFFFASGYGLTVSLINKKDYLKSFFRKRLLSVFIPYWIVNIVDILLNLCNGKTFTSGQYIASFFGADTVTGLWFVPSIILIYIAFYLSFKICDVLNKGYNLGAVLVSVFILLYCVAFSILYPEESSRTASVFAFLIGIIIALNIQKFKSWTYNKYTIKTLIFSFSFCVLFLARLYISSKGIDNLILMLVLRNIISILFIISLILISMKFKMNGKVISFIGSISYELYLVHFILIDFIFAIISNKSIALIILIAVSLILSFAIKKLSGLLLKYFQRKQIKE